MTRAELEQLIAEYSHRTDLSNVIDFVIDFSTKRIGRDLRSQENEVAIPFTPAVNPAPLPADFQALRHVTYDADRGAVTLRSVSTHFLTRFSDTGQPQVYSIKAKEIYIAPFQVRDFVVTYWQTPAALIAASDTNPVLDEYPYLYLYAALIEVYTWAQDDTQRDRALSLYSTEIELQNKQAAKADQGDAPQMQAV